MPMSPEQQQRYDTMGRFLTSVQALLDQNGSRLIPFVSTPRSVSEIDARLHQMTSDVLQNEIRFLNSRVQALNAGMSIFTQSAAVMYGYPNEEAAATALLAISEGLVEQTMQRLQSRMLSLRSLGLFQDLPADVLNTPLFGHDEDPFGKQQKEVASLFARMKTELPRVQEVLSRIDHHMSASPSTQTHRPS